MADYSEEWETYRRLRNSTDRRIGPHSTELGFPIHCKACRSGALQRLPFRGVDLGLAVCGNVHRRTGESLALSAVWEALWVQVVVLRHGTSRSTLCTLSSQEVCER